MNDLTISSVHAWEALDSRGRPTVACRVGLAGGGEGRAIVPAGASTGSHEAIERRDGGSRYGGWGVAGAVAAVREQLGPLVLGRSAGQRRAIDEELERADGTPGLGRLGANAVLAVSLAVTLAGADGAGIPLWRALNPEGRPLIPMPMVNILSGGVHAGGAIDLQDFLAVPIGAHCFAEALEWVSDVRAACASLLDDAGGWSALVADEGGLSARLGRNERALELLTWGIERSGHDPSDEVAIAIDVAATQLTRAGRIVLTERAEPLSADEWTTWLEDWVARYPICSIEDPLGEDEWQDWADASGRLAGIQVLGDDLFATGVGRLRRGVEEGVANAVLVKVNQAGTVSRAEDVVRAAQAAGYARVVSARSGDTEDHWLADLAVGWRAGQIKVGSTTRSERTAKWNRLLEIESDVDSVFAGASALAPLPRT